MKEWLAVIYNTTAGRMRAEQAHRDRVASGNRRVYVRQAQNALGRWDQSVEVQLKADELKPNPCANLLKLSAGSLRDSRTTGYGSCVTVPCEVSKTSSGVLWIWRLWYRQALKTSSPRKMFPMCLSSGSTG